MKTPELVIRLDDIPPEGLEIVLNIDPERLRALVAAEGQTPPAIRTPLTGDLKVTRSDQRLTLRGSFQVGVEISCDRCLNDTATVVSGRVDESLLLAEPGRSGALGDEDEETESLTAENGQVNIAGLVAEYFWLAWPFRFICRPDCAGLCPRCGADLNDGPCGCQNKRIN